MNPQNEPHMRFRSLIQPSSSIPQPSDQTETMNLMLQAERMQARNLKLQLERMAQLLRLKDEKINQLETQNKELRKIVQAPVSSSSSLSYMENSMVGNISASIVQVQSRENLRKGSMIAPSVGSAPKSEVKVQNSRINNSSATLLSLSGKDVDEPLQTCVRSKAETMRQLSPSLSKVLKKSRHIECSTTSFNSSMLNFTGGQNQPSVPFRLFQTFLIVSTDCLTKPNKSGVYPPAQPRILLSYPIEVNANQAQIIPGLCYPNGVHCRQLSNCQQAKQVLLKNKAYEIELFTMNTDITNGNTQQQYNEVVEAINPSYRLFGISFKCRGIAKTANHQNFYEVNKTYTFLTYFPFVSFFSSALISVVSYLRNQEYKLLPQLPSSFSSNLLSKCLESLVNQTISSCRLDLRFKCLETPLTLLIPDQNHLDRLALQYCLQCLSKVDTNTLADLLIYILYQEFVLIYSSSSVLLSQVILLILIAIRPLKYPFPVVMNLPNNMKFLLQSPFPTILGTTTPEQNLKDSSLSESSVKKLYFNLDTLQIKRRPEWPDITDFVKDCRTALAHAKQKQDIEVYRKMLQIVNEQLLNVYVQSTLPHVVRFRGTGIYKRYIQNGY